MPNSLSPSNLARLSRRADDDFDARVAALAGTDPDRAVERVANLLDAMLRWKPGAGSPPLEAKAILDEASPLPDWAVEHGGLARLRRAQCAFVEREAAAFIVLGFASLPACYAHPEVAELLASTGRLAVQVFRRLRETADFVSAVTRKGAFEPGGLGLLWCRKVRLVHSLMRFLARHQPPEQASPTGRELQDFLLRRAFAENDPEPIDQTELAFVLQTFAYLGVRGLRTLRIQLTRTESEDLLFLWCVVGHHLGIEYELLPVSIAGKGRRPLETASRTIYETLDARNLRRRRPDSGRLLTAALLVTMQGVMLRTIPKVGGLRRRATRTSPLHWSPRPVARWVDVRVAEIVSSAPRSFLRRLLGRRHARLLGVDRAPLLHHLGHHVAFFTSASITRERYEQSNVPRARARTPAEAWRRSAALSLGARVQGWQRLKPPPYLDQ
jgi:hypothetical protein